MQYVYFQLVSHKHLFEEDADEEEEVTLTKGGAGGTSPVSPLRARVCVYRG